MAEQSPTAATTISHRSGDTSRWIHRSHPGPSLASEEHDLLEQTPLQTDVAFTPALSILDQCVVRIRI